MSDRDSALKTLYTRLIDSRDGYKEAHVRAESAYIKGVLSDMVERRTRDAAELRSHLTRLGHELDDDGSILAAAHRSFLAMKDMVTGSGDEAILEEIVRGEKHLDEAYHDAIEASGPTHAEYSVLKDQHAALVAKLNEFKARAKAA